MFNIYIYITSQDCIFVWPSKPTNLTVQNHTSLQHVEHCSSRCVPPPLNSGAAVPSTLQLLPGGRVRPSGHPGQAWGPSLKKSLGNEGWHKVDLPPKKTGAVATYRAESRCENELSCVRYWIMYLMGSKKKSAKIQVEVVSFSHFCVLFFVCFFGGVGAGW